MVKELRYARHTFRGISHIICTTRKILENVIPNILKIPDILSQQYGYDEINIGVN